MMFLHGLLIAATALTDPCSPADLSAFDSSDYARADGFRVKGTVLSLNQTCNFILGDGRGRVRLWYASVNPKPGDILIVSGHTSINDENLGSFVVDSFTKIGEAPVPQPVLVTPRDLHSGEFDFATVRLRGFVTDATVDEIDPGWCYFVIRSGAATAYAFTPRDAHAENLGRFINAEVELTGICIPKESGLRVFLGPLVELQSVSNITIIASASENPFDAPILKDFRHISAASVSTMERQRIAGQVIALWQGNRFLLKTDDRRIVGVETASGVSSPEVFESIEVVGFPQTDLFRINLSRAQWRRIAPAAAPVETVDLPMEVAFTQEIVPRFWPMNHGKLLRLEGTVRNMPASGNFSGRINLSCGNYLVPIDINGCPQAADGLTIGCRIRVDGVCVTEIPNWHSDAAFPHLKGFFLVVRKPTDVTIVSRPPWWTAPGRLQSLIGTLLAALVGIFIWNLSLRRIAERRGRELFKAEIGKVGAELRIGERTRLAAELHDSIAQNLTAISFQIASAISAKELSPAASERHLENADRMLHSCRTQLRRCLWDLRSDTLEAPDFDQAIRMTVSEVLGEATAHVRFNVPRVLVSDTTAHAVLSIIRELTANAVLHGNARNVWIDGETSRHQLRFTVRDDGCGFNAAAIPGEASGHFGIKGIRERLEPLDGSLQLNSDRHGTCAVVTIHIRQQTDETHGQNQNSHC